MKLGKNDNGRRPSEESLEHDTQLYKTSAAKESNNRSGIIFENKIAATHTHTHTKVLLTFDRLWI